jgi:hypothetical protein
VGIELGVLDLVRVVIDGLDAELLLALCRVLMSAPGYCTNRSPDEDRVSMNMGSYLLLLALADIHGVCWFDRVMFLDCRVCLCGVGDVERRLVQGRGRDEPICSVGAAAGCVDAAVEVADDVFTPVSPCCG